MEETGTGTKPESTDPDRKPNSEKDAASRQTAQASKPSSRWQDIRKRSPDILKWWPVFASILAGLSVVLSAYIGYMVAQTDRAGLNQRVAYLESRSNESTKDLNALNERNRRLMDLVVWALQMGRLTEPEVAPYVEVPKSPVGLDRKIQITFPIQPAPPRFEPMQVDAQLFVRGVSHTPLDGKQIWIVTSLPGVAKLYPQGSWSKNGAMMGPAVVNATGRWSSATVSLGSCDKKLRECHWDIIAVLADTAAADEFQQYLERGAPKVDGGQGQGFPGINQLPQGTEEFDRVEVVTANPDYKP